MKCCASSFLLIVQGAEVWYNKLMIYAQGASDMERRLEKTMDEKRVRQLNGLQLAFIGDTIYDLFVRGDVLERHDESVQKLHKRAVARVNAAAQARAFDRVEPLLTQEEADVARRARNAHSRPPKHQDPGDYSRATALEALCGYLYLCGRHDRLGQLLGEINREEQNG